MSNAHFFLNFQLVPACIYEDVLAAVRHNPILELSHILQCYYHFKKILQLKQILQSGLQTSHFLDS